MVLCNRITSNYIRFTYLLPYYHAENRGSFLKGKIIAGRRLFRVEERPYVASLKKKNLHLATATLISKKSLLTAAYIIIEHQNRDQKYEGYTIVAGTNSLEYGGVSIPVFYMRVHPEYSKRPHITSPYNIALVVVSRLNNKIIPDEFGLKTWFGFIRIKSG